MKISHIIFVLVLAVSVSVMIATFGDASSYETFQAAKDNQGVTFHVVGTLVDDKEQYYDPQENPDYFTFYMRDSLQNEMKVVYNDGKPTEFDKPDKLVVIGKAVSDTEFHADQILQKCPSKYKNEEFQTVTNETL